LAQQSILSLLPPEIARLSFSPREVVLPQREALLAIDVFESAGLLILGWEGWVRDRHGHVGHGTAPQGTASLESLSVREAADLCRRTIRREAAAWALQFPSAEEELGFCITVKTK